jgi:uncharacterized protein (TIGR02145 family)
MLKKSFLVCLGIVNVIVLVITISCEKDNNNTLIDKDGNLYSTVTICKQVWMVENLKTTKFNDGTEIPQVKSNSTWIDLTTPGYFWYYHDQSIYGNTYGALYNWYAVETDKLCPCGWHIPTDDEWTILINYLGGESVAGGKLKETGTTHWLSPNTGATNENGFTSLPGGFRDYYVAGFNRIGDVGIWWSSTDSTASLALYRSMFYNFSDVERYVNSKKSGISVRCIKD